MQFWVLLLHFSTFYSSRRLPQSFLLLQLELGWVRERTHPVGWGHIKVGRDKKNFSFSQSLTSTLKFSFYCIFGLPPPPHTNSLRCWHWRFFSVFKYSMWAAAQRRHQITFTDVQFKRKKQIEQQRKFRKISFSYFLSEKRWEEPAYPTRYR